MIAGLFLCALLASPQSALPERATLAIGSCASDVKFPRQAIWDVMRAARPDAVVLLGDTPYIDSTDLEVQRARYRTFFALPEVAALRAEAPFWCTWDDHDFGTNDCDGTIAGKENSRRAFLEAHPEREPGEDGQGIYTSFRRGPIEVFLLDTRWFMRTEPSPIAEGPTLLGARQWAWLKRGLLASTAPFKLLACGMVWNDAVRPAKTDYWGAFADEREALFRFLGEQRISGVVLVSGDIHRSRVIRHATRETVGYELTELISSPLAQSVIASADAPHPGLVWDAGVEQTCLVVDATDSRLEARFLQAADPARPAELFTTRLFAAHLKGTPALSTTRTGFLHETIRVGEREWRYVVYVPRAWKADGNGAGLVFLHGMGESGVDGSLQLVQGLGSAVQRAPAEWPFVIVFPQKPDVADEWEQHEPAVLAMLERTIADQRIHPKRIGLTGLSQGGHGTWEFARRHPERFAALAPICGYPTPPARGWRDFVRERDWTRESAVAGAGQLAETLKSKPIWAFHGEADESVPVAFTQVVIDALRSRGAQVELTLYPGVGHNSWDDAYRESGLARWSTQQLR